MERKFIFIFILLTILSMVNAIPKFSHRLHKRATTFIECPSGVPTFNVTLYPDPVIPGVNSTFSISGSPAQDITTGSQLGVFFFTNFNDSTAVGNPFKVNVCSLISCPKEAGDDFFIVIDVPVPVTLPTSYIIIIMMVNSTKEEMACAGTLVGDGTVSSTVSPSPSSSSVVSASPTSVSSGEPGNGSGGIQDALKLIIF